MFSICTDFIENNIFFSTFFLFLGTLIVLGGYHISETTGANTINLAGATVVSFDREVVTIELTEAQRAAAVVSSNTPGGDNSAVVLDVAVAAAKDVAGNNNLLSSNLVVTESPDVVRPVIFRGDLDLTDGTLVITTSETLDLAIPSAEVDLTRMHVANGLVHVFALGAGSATAVDVVQHSTAFQANGYVVWTLGVSGPAATLTGEGQGVTVSQLNTNAVGTLRVALTGTTVTTITITAAIGSASFTADEDVIINGGT